LQDLQKRFHGSMLEPIHRATILRECAVEGKTIFEMAPESRAAKQYAELIKYVMNWGK
jgi:chromosome partitioning protein